MKMVHLFLLMATGVCGVIVAALLMPGPAPWLARESLFEFTAREPEDSEPAEPGTEPDHDPAPPRR